MRTTSVVNVNNTLNKFVITNFPSLICKKLRRTISIFRPFFKVTFISHRTNSQLFYNFCHKIEMFYKSDSSKWCYVKICHLLETCP